MALALVLLLFAAASFVSHRFGGLKAGGLAPAASRKAMRELVLERVDGGEWRLTEHRGQVVLINLWATWCGPCREETPGLVSLAKELGPEGLAVMGISLDAGGGTAENRAKVAAFEQRYHVPYPVTFPGAGLQMEFGVEGVPTTLLVDKEGRVAKTYVGAVRRDVFQADVEELLKNG